MSNLKQYLENLKQLFFTLPKLFYNNTFLHTYRLQKIIIY